ncbi:MAG TPA: acyltransferase family protein, partial [Pseudoneobacillus sp.]|nr:acyltransferase family protein [Pseudoneobacillus sp.]
FETTPLLTHFWSLAIEEQFYIFWAVVILLLLKFVKNRKFIFLLLIIGSIISAIRMMLMYDPNLDPSRVYYGTDTRIFSLIIGASFAFISPNQQIKASKIKKWAYEILGIIGFSVFLLMVTYSNQYDSFIYCGGMLILSITTAFLITSIGMPSTKIINKTMNLKPLTWIGIRSYGIYLWHYPIIMLMNSKINTGGIDYLKIILEVTLTFLLASISYTFVEKPIRHGTFRFNLKNSLVIATAVFCLIFITNSNWVFQKDVTASIKEVQQLPVHNNIRDEGIRKQPHVQPQPVTKGNITAIGDSVLINPTPLLKERIPNITIDAKMSRQMVSASAIVKEQKNTNHLGDIVIIELGTNGPFTEETLSDLITTIGKDRKVLLINVRVPRPWETAVNKRLMEASKKFIYVSIIDWYSTSAKHNEYFVKDGVHLNPKGAEAYAMMIEKAVQK